ncbi:MAG: formylglycine-generating enzyme family protein [Kiritimatiellaeota bacterium]|nr:formylglycine-generating enzyme family protein [Kiritimatiellota bacterium]
MQYIPAGSFAMGDASFGEVGEGMADERPVHTVTMSAFYLEDQEVTAGLWETVRNWGAGHGYTDLPVLTSSGSELPAVGMTWFDAVKWCNARSEMEGLAPVYFTDGVFSNVYRTGTNELTAAQWRSGINHAGYRLPTEAEWERAARGGLDGRIFPWASSTTGSYLDNISTNQANFNSSAPTTVATFPANGFGLFDMAGNAAEWCWDWYDASYFSLFSTNSWPANPRGPDARPTSSLRMTRGGSWSAPAFDLRCSFRDPLPPTETGLSQGFRCARDFAGNEDFDRDGDGLPDWWLQTYFGHPTGLVSDLSRATDDATGTGMNNLQKYVAGLDPTNSLSVFRAAPVGVSATGFVILWSSVSNRTYNVLFSTNLIEGFSVMETNLPASPPVNVYTDSVHKTAPMIFYKVGVQP